MTAQRDPMSKFGGAQTETIEVILARSVDRLSLALLGGLGEKPSVDLEAVIRGRDEYRDQLDDALSTLELVRAQLNKETDRANKLNSKAISLRVDCDKWSSEAGRLKCERDGLVSKIDSLDLVLDDIRVALGLPEEGTPFSNEVLVNRAEKLVAEEGRVKGLRAERDKLLKGIAEMFGAEDSESPTALLNVVINEIEKHAHSVDRISQRGEALVEALGFEGGRFTEGDLSEVENRIRDLVVHAEASGMGDISGSADSLRMIREIAEALKVDQEGKTRNQTLEATLERAKGIQTQQQASLYTLAVEASRVMKVVSLPYEIEGVMERVIDRGRELQGALDRFVKVRRCTDKVFEALGFDGDLLLKGEIGPVLDEIARLKRCADIEGGS